MYVHSISSDVDFMQDVGSRTALLAVVWLVLAAEMAVRFFPSRQESTGSQKQLARNYAATGEDCSDGEKRHSVLLTALAWIGFNLVFGALNLLGVLDDGFMVLLSAAYAVCDEACILLFCPFMQWFLHNDCCTTCRIYNWNYAMMFTPLFFVPGVYTWSLLAIALALLVQWELAARRHPERFSKRANAYLSCQQCTDKLCQYKRQIKAKWRCVNGS